MMENRSEKGHIEVDDLVSGAGSLGEKEPAELTDDELDSVTGGVSTVWETDW